MNAVVSLWKVKWMPCQILIIALATYNFWNQRMATMNTSYCTSPLAGRRLHFWLADSGHSKCRGSAWNFLVVFAFRSLKPHIFVCPRLPFSSTSRSEPWWSVYDRIVDINRAQCCGDALRKQSTSSTVESFWVEKLLAKFSILSDAKRCHLSCDALWSKIRI